MTQLRRILGISAASYGLAACEVEGEGEGELALVEEADADALERAVYYYPTQITADPLFASALRCVIVVDTTDYVHRLTIDQPMLDQMWTAVSGTLQVEFTQQTGFSFVGLGSGFSEVEIEVTLGGQTLAVFDESRTGPPSGTFRATRVAPISADQLAGVAVGDVLEITASGWGTAAGNGCSSFDQAIVSWQYTSGGAPFLRTIP